MGIGRRAFIGSSIVGAFAGCTEPSSSSDSPDSGSSSGGGRSTPEPQELLDRTFRVAEDDHRGTRFTLNYDVRLELEFTVRSGPEVEIFVMEDDEYSQFRNDNRFYAEQYSGVNGRGSVNLSSAKDWAFVVDNSNAGSVSPPTNFDDDVAEVEVSATLYYVG